ncbi:MAG: trypsin-like serine protease [Bacteriovoracaceae bacterium]
MKNLFVLLIAILSAHAWAIDFSNYNSALMLQIVKEDNNKYICSSVAYSQSKLITAAHCLENATQVNVFKEFKILDNNTFYKTKTFYKSKLYNKNQSFFLNDVGIIELEESLPSEIKIYPIAQVKINQGELHRVGFGMRNGINSRTVIWPINQFQVHENYIEAWDQYSFYGDSGGPIFQLIDDKFYLIGIHSTKDGNYTFNPLLAGDEI